MVFTKNPEGRATMGKFGGGVRVHDGVVSPGTAPAGVELFGDEPRGVQEFPTNAASPHGAWEYHEHFIPETKAKPIRVWVAGGENDLWAKRDEASFHNWVMANNRMAAALKAKWISLSICLLPGRRPRGPEGGGRNAAGGLVVAVAGISDHKIGFPCERL